MSDGIFKNGELSEEDAKDLERQVSKIIDGDYIKREDAIRANENYVPYQRLGEDRQSYMDRILKELPNADVVEIVRCKDCKYWHDWHCAEPVISPWEGRTNKSARAMNDFCSYGERKEQEHGK